MAAETKGGSPAVSGSTWRHRPFSIFPYQTRAYFRQPLGSLDKQCLPLISDACFPHMLSSKAPPGRAPVGFSTPFFLFLRPTPSRLPRQDREQGSSGLVARSKLWTGLPETALGVALMRAWLKAEEARVPRRCRGPMIYHISRERVTLANGLSCRVDFRPVDWSQAGTYLRAYNPKHHALI